MKIALVGCGNWGKLILRDLKLLGASVAAVARSKESVDRAKEGGAESVHLSIDELPPVDAAVVATPTSTHVEVLEKVVKKVQGPVYVEKPLGVSSKAASRLKRHENRIFIMDKWRYHPGVLELAKIAKGRELGRVIGLRTHRTAWGGRHSDTDVVWHLMPHELAIGLEILGELPKPGSGVIEEIDGLATSMVAVLKGKPWLVSEVSERSDDPRRRVTLISEGGIATLQESYATSIVVTTDSGSRGVTSKREIRSSMPLYEELRAFVEHVKGGPPPKSSFVDGLLMVKAIEELVKLSRGGKVARA